MGDGTGTALWFSAPEFEILAVRDDGPELGGGGRDAHGTGGVPGVRGRARAKDRRWVTLRDAPTAERSVLVRWRKRVFCCPDRDCRVRTWTEQASLAEPRRGAHGAGGAVGDRSDRRDRSDTGVDRAAVRGVVVDRVGGDRP